MPEEANEMFEEHKVVPDVLRAAPLAILKVTYNENLEVSNGNVLTPTQVSSQPTVEWDADDDAFYTLIMTDPDAPTRIVPKFREYLHWCVVNIPGNNIDKGEVLCEYVGSAPPRDTGYHRYIFLIFKQPGKVKFKEYYIPKNTGAHRAKFNTQNFADRYNLSDAIAGNLFQAEWDDHVSKVHKQLSGKA